MQRYIVLLESGCWLAWWRGDPGRTCLETSAKVFRSRKAAEQMLSAARQYRPFPDAQIIEV